MFQFIQNFATTRVRKKKPVSPVIPDVGLVGMEVHEHPTREQRATRNAMRMRRIQQKMDELKSAGLSGEERYKKLKREMFIREGK
jgi:hypothetical protein